MSEGDVAVVFRADAGTNIGGGHVMRSLALASGFAARGLTVAFACNAETLKTMPALASASFEKIVVSGTQREEASQIGDKYARLNPIIVADHYARGIEFERACREFAKSVAVIDDLADREHDTDVLIDSGASSAVSYLPLVPAHCKICTGPNYAIIHPDFVLARDAALPRRDGRPVSRILVTFGQIDAGNATGLALDSVEEAGFTGAVDVVLGQAAPHLSAIRRRAKGRVSLHVNISNMPAMIATSDLAIGAGGVTAFERCCLGLPSIVVQIAENQREVIATLATAGAAISVGPAEHVSKEALSQILREVLSSRERRIDLANRGAMLVDGKGIGRIVDAILGFPAIDTATK